ncbi:Bug family tripartite tricarboxylate transporter substrate binding protein [Piscinibacter sp.]|uniref:Bug family tripartite tricarboxylate transporter substrate binding protein n=1 Tax=Piscinibacter sp. TaxID=1903157 RepID=UPI0039E6A41B
MTLASISRRALVAAAALALLGAGPAGAETYPSKPLRILVPFPPGGPSDTVTRLVGQRLSETMAQPIVIDNRPGGGGQIAASALLQAPADGYTLFVGDVGALSINPSLYAKLTFDPLKDFQGISTLMSASMVLVVPAASPIASVKQLLAKATAQKSVQFSSPGIGTGSHMLSEMLRSQANANFQHVPYKGTAAAVQGVMAEEVDFMFENVGAVAPLAKAGKVKAIAIADMQRNKFLPEVPTMSEQGLPTVKMSPWWALVARAGTPDAVVQRLHAEVSAALSHPAVVRRLNELGFEPMLRSPEETQKLIRDEGALWGSVVKAAGIKVE